MDAGLREGKAIIEDVTFIYSVNLAKPISARRCGLIPKPPVQDRTVLFYLRVTLLSFSGTNINEEVESSVVVKPLSLVDLL